MTIPRRPDKRKLALGVVMAAYALSFFHRFAPAGIAQDLATSFQTSAASLGTLAATYFYVYTLMQIPTGVLVDTLGPRRILVTGGGLAALGSIVFGLAPDLPGALAGRTLIGLGVSVVFIAMLKLIALWFPENRFATMVGLGMLLGNLGSVLAGTPLAALAQLTSWRDIFVGVGCLSGILALGCWATVEERSKGQGPAFDRTLVMDGLLTVIRNRASWPPLIINFGMAGSFFSFAGLWASPYLMQVHGLERVDAASHLSLYFGTFAVGCLAIGSLSDRLGRRRPVLMVGAWLYALLWLLVWSGIRLSPMASYTLFGLMGLATASFSLTWACSKEVNPPQLSGISTSITNIGGFLAAALLQPLTGAIMDAHRNGTLADGVGAYGADAIERGIAPMALAAGLAAVASFWLRETGCRNIWQGRR